MKLRYQDGREIEVDELKVECYYEHISSGTYWKVHSIEATPFGNVVELEIINEYKEVLNLEQQMNMRSVFAKSGKFKEITKKEFISRRK
jgi:hypothetical protein